MTSSLVDTKNVISLKGSVAIVSEFFFTAINSILYQRGIYPPESFKRESKYGLTVLTTTHERLLNYLKQVIDQMEAWLVDGDVQRLVVVVSGLDTGETLERWQFNITLEEKENISRDKNRMEIDADITETTASLGKESLLGKGGGSKFSKSVKEIHDEIQAIIRQITASVTFLPLLNEPCSFDLLVYTNKDASVPNRWEDSDPHYILNSQDVKLRSFSTSVHKVDSMVTYKDVDEWEL